MPPINCDYNKKYKNEESIRVESVRVASWPYQVVAMAASSTAPAPTKSTSADLPEWKALQAHVKARVACLSNMFEQPHPISIAMINTNRSSKIGLG